MMKTNPVKFALAILLAGVLGTSCTKTMQPGEEALLPETNAAASDISIAAVNSNINVNWNNYANGTYTSANAATDFGNASGWVNSRAYISSGNLRVTLLPNALSGAGGLISNIDVTDGSAYELDFDVRFHSQFDFSRGGKIGFGFLVGEGNTGGDPGHDGNGGSLRLMWYTTDAGRTFFQPYVYHRDQSTNFGDTWGRSYPSSGSLVKGQTYHVHMYIKSNTGSSTNGRVQILINGTALIDQAIRWTTNDAQRLINRVSFHTFRGGSQSYWESSTVGYIYYDNLVVNRIS